MSRVKYARGTKRPATPTALSTRGTQHLESAIRAPDFGRARRPHPERPPPSSAQVTPNLIPADRDAAACRPPDWRVDGRVHCFSVPRHLSDVTGRIVRATSSRRPRQFGAGAAGGLKLAATAGCMHVARDGPTLLDCMAWCQWMLHCEARHRIPLPLRDDATTSLFPRGTGCSCQERRRTA